MVNLEIIDLLTDFPTFGSPSAGSPIRFEID